MRLDATGPARSALGGKKEGAARHRLTSAVDAAPSTPLHLAWPVPYWMRPESQARQSGPIFAPCASGQGK